MKMNKLQRLCYEPFFVEGNTLQEFIKKNREYWKDKTPKQHNGKYLFINFMMIRKDIPMMLPKLIYAKGLEVETGAMPIVLDWNYNEQLERLYESFGIGYIAIRKNMLSNIPGMIKSAVCTLGYVVKGMTGEELKKLQWKGAPVGMFIYEDIIRTSDISTIRTVRNKSCIKKLFSLLMFTEAVSKMCQKYEPQICLSDDFPYNEGIALAIMAKHGATVIQAGLKRDRMITYGNQETSTYKHHYLHRYVKEHLPIREKDDYNTWMDKYLQDRFQGKLGPVIDRVAYLGKKVCNREELVQTAGLDPNKKNVIIMTHVFSDATFQSGNYCFRDNYDWTEQTLAYAATDSSVNWLIKPHPARHSYNDSLESVEKLIAKYPSPNIHVFPDEFSTESLLEVADALVTICGTSGMEFTCFGIPVVIVGNAYYNGFGFTNHPTTKDEYFEMLSNIKDMEPLTQEQIQMARKVSYTFGFLSESRLDEYDRELSNDYQNMSTANTMEGCGKGNTEFLQRFIQYIEKDEIKEMAYYKLGSTRMIRDSVDDK